MLDILVHYISLSKVSLLPTVLLSLPFQCRIQVFTENDSCTYCTGNSISKLMSATIEKGTEKRRARMCTKSHPLDCQWKSDPNPLQRNQQASSIKQLSFFKSRYNPIPYSMAKKKKKLIICCKWHACLTTPYLPCVDIESKKPKGLLGVKTPIMNRGDLRSVQRP